MNVTFHVLIFSGLWGVLVTANAASDELNNWLGPFFVAMIFAFTSIAVVNTLIIAIGLGIGLAIAATALLPLSHALTGGFRPYAPAGLARGDPRRLRTASPGGPVSTDPAGAAHAAGRGNRDP
jgi:hypothetical protein